MALFKNIAAFFKVIGGIRKVDHYSKGVIEAREAGDPEKERRVIAEDLKIWANSVADDFDLKIDVTGKENLPKDDGYVYIANHQGYADIIALILAAEDKQLGFIAKDQLEKVPYLGRWIKQIRGLFIRRGDAREALKSMREGIDLVKQGYNLAIFPEGTRSRGPEMGEFKPGSFKLATKAKAGIVPVTISGSYKCFEEPGYPVPATIKVKIHPVVETKTMDRKQILAVEHDVPEIIRAGLAELSEDGAPERPADGKEDD